MIEDFTFWAPFTVRATNCYRIIFFNGVIWLFHISNIRLPYAYFSRIIIPLPIFLEILVLSLLDYELQFPLRLVLNLLLETYLA